jgi:hypothetical protein
MKGITFFVAAIQSRFAACLEDGRLATIPPGVPEELPCV